MRATLPAESMTIFRAFRETENGSKVSVTHLKRR
jgi:hypothetical protein